MYIVVLRLGIIRKVSDGVYRTCKNTIPKRPSLNVLMSSCRAISPSPLVVEHFIVKKDAAFMTRHLW